MDQPIYLDHHATTPTDKRVLEKMLPFFCESFGNVGSGHCFGRSVRKACTEARENVANLMNVTPEEIIFTSGATESNNLAIKGVAEALKNHGTHIITSIIEHKAVLDCCRFLETQGFEVTYIKPDHQGRITAEQVKSEIRTGKSGAHRTILVSIMGANNEIGNINPTREIGMVCKEHDVIYHCDGAQTVGKIPFHPKELGADMVSLSGHKIYGPKGIGALYVTKDNANLNLVPLFHGGGQESGIRSGTLPVPLVVGMGEACRLAQNEMDAENERLVNLREEFWKLLQNSVSHVEINGDPENRLPGNLNVRFSGIESEFLSLAFKNIAVSQSSACSSQATKPSYVLKAIGLSDDEALCSVRFGLGHCNTIEEVQFVISKLEDIYKKFGVKSKTPKDKLQEAGY